MKYLLRSDEIERLSENDVYYFLGAWFFKRGFFCQKSCETLLKCLRFNKIDAHYWQNVLPSCPLLEKAGAVAWALHSAMSIYMCGELSDGNDAEWIFSITVPLPDLLDLRVDGGKTTKLVGLIAGYPLLLIVECYPGEHFTLS